LFDESQDKDIAGKIKNCHYLEQGILEKNPSGIEEHYTGEPVRNPGS
jgi:hypothetical protein